MKRRFRGLGMPREQELRTKRRIRGRDGNRCVVCQIDEQTHEKRYGRICDVHRPVRRSEYSTKPGVGFTLCEVCHDALEGKRHWGWIAKDHPVTNEWLAASVQQSSRRDLHEEEKWRRHEAWGAWVKKLRETNCRSLRMFAILSDLSEETLR